MKLIPSDKQFEYLRSIGAWNDGHPTFIPTQKRQRTLPFWDAIDRWKWWWIAILCGVAILVFADVAFSHHTEEINKTQSVITGSTDLDDVDITKALPSLAENESKSIFRSDVTTIVVTLLLYFGVLSVLMWWFLRYLINAIQRIAISIAPLPLDQIPYETPRQPQASVPKNHIRRLFKTDIPSPENLLQTLANYAKASPTISHIPIKPTWPWSMGFATHIGNVRKENQDYVICFRIGEFDVLIGADGLGGLPQGQRASFLAVFEAAKSTLQQLGSRSSWRPASLTKVLRKALSQAQHILSTYGDKLRITDINGGLRTTIIVVLAKGSELHYGYIGDGGLDILRTDGSLESLMTPQKHGQFLNVLSASLGPQRQGEFVIGQTDRSPGDLIIISTDGIADRIDAPAFARDIMRNAIRSNGDLHVVARQIVEELASCKDEHGYICDDNLTLALLGTEQTPLLGSGFWTESTSESETAIVDDTSDEETGATQPAVEGTSS
jgi:serine/threonine protein phosphatase PrpC